MHGPSGDAGPLIGLLSQSYAALFSRDAAACAAKLGSSLAGLRAPGAACACAASRAGATPPHVVLGTGTPGTYRECVDEAVEQAVAGEEPAGGPGTLTRGMRVRERREEDRRSMFSAS